ncbi:hypothetical protein FRC07_002940 [Ceratobasidium sp. 392]|nr:hypothetical protein FRC07_002940 [Ceratobasidium sp. 392]
MPIGTRRLPNLISMIRVVANPDAPRVTAVTVQGHKPCICALPVTDASTELEAGVYWTPSPGAPVVPRMTPTDNSADVPAVSSRVKRSITIQRLGMQTPSPPMAVQFMSTRGGGRFSVTCLPEFYRPAEERFTVQYAEYQGIVVGEHQSIVPYGGLRSKALERDPVPQPQQLRRFKHLIAKRTYSRYMKSMDPLNRAIHNNLAYSMDLKAISDPPRGRARSCKRIGPKSECSLRMRRDCPAIVPLNMDAVCAYKSVNPMTDSPPDSPGPITPVEDITDVTKNPKEIATSANNSKTMWKGVGY